jgi:hypothetical protein
MASRFNSIRGVTSNVVNQRHINQNAKELTRRISLSLGVCVCACGVHGGVILLPGCRAEYTASAAPPNGAKNAAHTTHSTQTDALLLICQIN